MPATTASHTVRTEARWALTSLAFLHLSPGVLALVLSEELFRGRKTPVLGEHVSAQLSCNTPIILLTIQALLCSLVGNQMDAALPPEQLMQQMQERF